MIIEISKATHAMGLELSQLTNSQRKRMEIFVLTRWEVPKPRIAAFLEVCPDTVEKWTVRQQDEPMIWDKARNGRNCVYTDGDENRIIAFYCQTKQLPKCARGKWTLRKAEQKLLKCPDEVGVSPGKSTIHRILNKHHLKPHRKKYFLHISDPDFIPKMEHILYLRKNPPKNLFSFDECSGIQVLLRLARDLFMNQSQDRVSLWLEEFEYIRNGTVDLFAFLDVNSGNVSCRCHATHDGKILSAIFRDHVMALPEDEKIYYIMDNLSTHSTYDFCRLVAELSNVECPPELEKSTVAKRRKWLQSDKKRIAIHFTPFHGSWLNPVEIWFGFLAATVLGESFADPDLMIAAIQEYTEVWNREYAHGFKCNYDGEGLHKAIVKRFIDFINFPLNNMSHLFLKKQFCLLANLLNGYREKVPNSDWNELLSQVNNKQKALIEYINEDTKPKRKIESLNAFSTLIHYLEICFGNNKTKKRLETDNNRRKTRNAA